MDSHTTSGSVIQNDNGAHLYLGPQFVHDSACLLEVGAEFVAVLAPEVGAVIVPGGLDAIEWPVQLTLDDPRTVIEPIAVTEGIDR